MLCFCLFIGSVICPLTERAGISFFLSMNKRANRINSLCRFYPEVQTGEKLVRYAFTKVNEERVEVGEC